MADPADLTACDALELIRARRLGAVELAEACLARIAALEPVIGAWCHLDPEGALAAARARDAAPPGGALHGIPLGVKDVIDTADMPSAYGSPIHAGWRPRTDAAAVAQARRDGAVVLGKTVTTAFASGGTVRTANPHNPDHTSGGSSAGSAAAVAAGMVPVAFGTQSASSLIRPASYCGLVGMRPSMGVISVAGFKYFNGSFDTIGLLGRDVDDVELLWTSQLGLPFARGGRPPAAPKVAVCRPTWLALAQPESHAAIDAAAARLAAAGAEVTELLLPARWDALVALHTDIQAFEAARSYLWEYEHHRDALDPRVRALIEQGLAIPAHRYIAMLREAAAARAEVPAVFGAADLVLTAAAPGEAPKGWRALGDAFASMGDTSQSRAWTLLHLPVVTVPCHRGPAGLPVGVQLIGRFGEDQALLHAARWIAEAIAPAPLAA